MRPNIGRVILGGFVGTLAITLMMYIGGPMMGMMKMDIADSLGKMMGVGWAMGVMVHFIWHHHHLWRSAGRDRRQGGSSRQARAFAGFARPKPPEHFGAIAGG